MIYKSSNNVLCYKYDTNIKTKIDAYLKNTTVEGYYTLKSIHKLLHDLNVEVPIIDLIYDIIFKNKEPKELLTFLVEKA